MPDYSATVKADNEDAIPVSCSGVMDMDPNRVGRRMIWQFKYADGSSLATYSSKKGFRLRQLMMKRDGL